MSSPSDSSSRPPYIPFSKFSPPATVPKGQSQDPGPVMSSPSFSTNASLSASMRPGRPGNATNNLSEKIGESDRRIHHFEERFIRLKNAAVDNESTYSSETLVDSDPSSSLNGPSDDEAWNPNDTKYLSQLREERRSQRGSRWPLHCTATAMWLAPVITPGPAVVIMAVPSVIGFWVIMLTS